MLSNDVLCVHRALVEHFGEWFPFGHWSIVVLCIATDSSEKEKWKFVVIDVGYSKYILF